LVFTTPPPPIQYAWLYAPTLTTVRT